VRVLKNILIAVGLLIGVLILGGVIDQVSPPRPGGDGAASGLVGLLLLGTAIWASISSYRLEFRKYNSGLSYHPVTVLLAHFLLWIVVFPWFLTVRDNIKDGSAEVKDEFKEADLSTSYAQADAPRTPSGPPVFGSFEAPKPVPPQPIRSSMPPPLPPPTPMQPSPVPPPLPSAVPMPPPLPLVVPVPPPLPSAATIPPPLPSPPPLPRPQPASINDRFEQLQKLAQLKEQGILTESEFHGEKQKILGQA
jgi:hypothetical protein